MSLLSSYGVGVSLHDQLLRRLNRVKEAKLLVCTPPKGFERAFFNRRNITLI
jgi:hypothetical protein